MTEQDKEIFEKYCKLEEALRIAKDYLKIIHNLPEDELIKSKIFSEAAFKQINEVLIEEPSLYSSEDKNCDQVCCKCGAQIGEKKHCCPGMPMSPSFLHYFSIERD